MTALNTFILVLSTVPDRKTASKLADILLSGKLAACVTISGPAKSIYLWKGKKESCSEFVLMIKTRKRFFSLLQKTIQKYHPYEVPEIIALPIAVGSPKYLSWLGQETRKA